MRHSARRRALVIAGSTVIAGFALVAPAYAATSGPSATTAVAGAPHTASGATLQPGGAMRHAVHPETSLSGAKNASTTSTNWSGYAATGSTYTSVASSWTEPTGTCKSGSQYSSFWVGLDGYNSGTVEQTGTDVDCAGRTPQYYAWYEIYPAASVEINQTVRPGDKISASVTYAGSSKFTLKISDSTRGWTYTIDQDGVGGGPLVGGGHHRSAVLYQQRRHPPAGRLRQGELHRVDGQRQHAQQLQPDRDHDGLGQRRAGGQHVVAEWRQLQQHLAQ